MGHGVVGTDGRGGLREGGESGGDWRGSRKWCSALLLFIVVSL